jgi:hypothetical protein
MNRNRKNSEKKNLGKVGLIAEDEESEEDDEQ